MKDAWERRQINTPLQIIYVGKGNSISLNVYLKIFNYKYNVLDIEAKLNVILYVLDDPVFEGPDKCHL